jgi:hypothetical protein
MGRFKINDRHVAFANAIAAGMDHYKAYQEYMSPGKKAKRMTASANASVLLKRKEIKDLVDRARKEREAAITGVMLREVGKEFSTTLLTVDELDNFNSAVIQGLVSVEEIVPTYTVNETLDDQGKVIKRSKTRSFVKITRPPNIREKQASVQELYKRFGNYAPSRLFAGVGRVNDEGDIENVERFIILSNGDRIPLNQEPKAISK